MKFKKLFTALLLSACLSQTATAIPAYPGVIKVRQADGTEISIRLRGDEWGHYTTTEDGFPLIFNKLTSNYEYAIISGQKLVSSNIVATDASMRDPKAMALLNTIDKTEVAKMALSENSATAAKGIKKVGGKPQKVLMNDFPHFGEQHSIVILVEFNDRSFSTVSNPKQYYTDMLNKEGFTYENGANGSARDFFIASSQGQFKPTFDVYGPVKIDYSQYDFGDGMQQGQANAGTILQTVVEKLDEEGAVNFAQYDHDGDGYVDNIYFYYAGYGSNDSGYSNVIWPHAFDMRQWGTYMKTKDGTGIGSYTCSNEIDGTNRRYPTGIGTFVHEFGHVLGFMDHYDTNSSYATYTPGYWDTMASGSYNNNCHTPPLYSAFECAELGWLELTELDNTAEGVNVLKPLADDYMAYKVNVDGKPNEYFILENRRRTSWDRFLQGEGMLVWHIDYNYDAWVNNTVNSISNHQRIDIVEAGNVQSNDYYEQETVPFPGSGNVSSHDFKDWSGTSAIYLDKIKKNGNNVEFIIKGSDQGLAAVADVNIDRVTYKSIECSWQAADKATEYVVSLKKVSTDNDGNEILIDIPAYNNLKITATNFEFDDLDYDTEYAVCVSSSIGTFKKKPTITKTATNSLPFNMTQVKNVQTSDLSPVSFTASWDALADAQGYKLYLMRNYYDGETISTAYDFTNEITGMPEGWLSSTNLLGTNDGFYGVASPSLRFTQKNKYLVMSNGGANITNVKFWMRAQQPGKGSKLEVYIENGDEWKLADEITLTSGNGEVYNIEVDPTTAVKLQYNRRSSGILYIDDVEVSGNQQRDFPVVNGKETKDTGMTFDALDSNAYYTLTVSGISNGIESLKSDPVQVKTLNGTDGIKGATVTEVNGNTAIFSIDGKQIEKLPADRSVFVIKQNGKSVKATK